MATYAAMKSRIAREVNRTDIADEISAAIQTAIRFYESRSFVFNHKRSDLSLLPAEYTQAPTDTADILFLRVKVNSSFWQEMYPLPFSDLERLFSVPVTTAEPDCYAFWNDKIYTYPQPDATVSAKVTYKYHVSPPTGDADTNAWTNDAEELIRLHAEVDIYEVTLRGPDAHEQAARLRLREQLTLNRLDTEFTERYSTGTIRNNSLLMGAKRYY